MLDVDVAARRVRVPAPHRDVAIAARRLSHSKHDPIEVDVGIGQHDVPQRQSQFEIESALRAQIGGRRCRGVLQYAIGRQDTLVPRRP